MGARVSPEERAQVGRLLSAAAAGLFQAMPLQDQRHGLDVAEAFLRKGESDSVLLAAALLHDVGKARAGLTLFHRTIVVLLQAGWPPGLVRLAGGATGWRRPFWAHVHHPQIGAELASQADCSELTIWLIRNHHQSAAGISESDRRDLLRALQRADGSH